MKDKQACWSASPLSLSCLPWAIRPDVQERAMRSALHQPEEGLYGGTCRRHSRSISSQLLALWGCLPGPKTFGRFSDKSPDTIVGQSESFLTFRLRDA